MLFFIQEAIGFMKTNYSTRELTVTPRAASCRSLIKMNVAAYCLELVT
jgi:hypothetical protein